ncbi:MAG: copper chaperone PCu(A)C [Thermomonas sp.]
MKSLLICLSLFLLAGCAQQDHQRIGDLVVSVPWSRETPPTASVAAGFVTIQNKGDRDDQLVRIESATAKRVELHTMRDDNGVMRMRQRVDGVPIPAGQTVVLKPGADHAMFIEPVRHAAAGEQLQATLVFRDAGRLQVAFAVRGMAEQGEGAHAHH